ncbi:MAG: heavy-metal-associated domain-containing protein [Chitinophagaceae bacterium]|nr:MAG: heavy-metal-associated domain-containing protein [Chitinophagaceae bacterium]
MENKKIQFKTNINCGSCIKSVTPHLNKLEGVEWSVDTDNPDKILTVITENISAEQIEKTVKRAGFNIQKIEE